MLQSVANCFKRGLTAEPVADRSQTVAIGCNTRKSVDSVFSLRCQARAVMLSQVAPAVPLVVERHSRCHEDLMNATIEAPAAAIVDELPMRVREAAVFLGVSPQTVYLWVERKQIPHLRVMGRNIRFLKSELEPFRAQFKQEMGNGKTE
jgi:excisionase family DNA binding protein